MSWRCRVRRQANDVCRTLHNLEHLEGPVQAVPHYLVHGSLLRQLACVGLAGDDLPVAAGGAQAAQGRCPAPFRQLPQGAPCVLHLSPLLAEEHAREADLAICLGTSLQITPGEQGGGAMRWAAMPKILVSCRIGLRPAARQLPH